jgi:molybdopterin-synthase adenylyltransferase
MKILFCGVGALGSHAVTLCRTLPVDLALADFDRVESKNLLSQASVRTRPS